MMTSEAMTLLECLKKHFGTGWFDAVDVFSRSSDEDLSRALGREILGLADGPMSPRVIRMALRHHPGILKRQHSAAGFWTFRVA